MTILQITDLHVGPPGELPFGVDVRTNFTKILAAVRAVPHDLLLISGDLCYQDGDRAIYAWIKTRLEEGGFTYVVTPGNHDDTDLMVECFGLRSRLCRGELFLTPGDTTQPAWAAVNSGPGIVSDTALVLLRDYLAKRAGPVCLFMHHPPLLMGVPYMDESHALRERQPLLDVLTAHPYPITVFTGHYHVEKSLRWKNLDVHVTPSCFFQIDWRQRDFAVDHYRIAYRHIVWDGASLEHAVVYV